MKNLNTLFVPRPSRAAGLFVLLVGMLLSCVASAGGKDKQTFPRLGGYQIGKTSFDGYGDPAYHAAMARLDYVILGSLFTNINDHARSIRQLNPNILLAKYTKISEIHDRFLGYPAIKRDKVNSEYGPNNRSPDWWARDYDGNRTSNWPGNYNVNITRYVQADSRGDYFPQWAARLDVEYWLHDSIWDAVFEDTVFWRPRTPSGGGKVDWSGGQESTTRIIESEFRNGHKMYWDKLKQLVPNRMIFVNHDWYRGEKTRGEWDMPEYDRQVHGGMLENIMTSRDLYDERTPWSTVREYYYNSMKYFMAPAVTMFVVRGEPDNYQFFRYAFATCLLNNGYFDYAPNNNYYFGTVEWFDEFDLAGRADTEWLGLAIDAPPRSAWKSGVWRRDFQGGAALVNPKGNGRVTVRIESGFRRIDGRQDSSVNNGRVADSITLEDGDGILLVRDNAFAVTASPQSPNLNVN